MDGKPETVPDLDNAETYAKLCHLAEALWHHIPPGQWDDLPPVTSTEARAAASKIIEIVRHGTP